MATMPEQKPGRSKQDYGTPEIFLDAVKRRLHIEEFDIDLAASEDNAVAPIYYTEEMNALKQEWKIGNGWNWLNPPFAHINPWVERAYNQAIKYEAQTAVLIPAGVGANWWRDWVHAKANILLLNGRITFKGTPPNPKTGKVDAYPKDCALLLYSRQSLDMGVQYNPWTWNE